MRGRLLSLCGLATALAACTPEEAGPPPVRPVLAARVHRIETVTFGPFTGFVDPRYRSQLGFQIGGRVAARDVTVGDVVKRGQRLAALDPTVTRFALVRAEAELADAQAQSANAGATEQRSRKLMEGSTLTQAQMDAAVAGRDTANARLTQARANLQKARDQIGYSELAADFDGVVTERLAEVGQVLSAGQGVVTLARPEVREAVVDIPEDLVGTMPADGRFTVALQSLPAVTAEGHVREIAPFAEAGTRSRRVRMSLVGPPAAFRLGATVTVSLARRVAPHVVLPATALLEADGGASVWVLAPDGASVTRRSVAVSGREADRVEIASGLEDGERVAVAGVHTLREGQAVRVVETAR